MYRTGISVKASVLKKSETFAHFGDMNRTVSVRNVSVKLVSHIWPMFLDSMGFKNRIHWRMAYVFG